MNRSTASSAACQQLLASIAHYLDGDLDTGACADVERHCASCASCAELLDSLRLTVGLCRQAASLALPDNVRRRARARVEQLLDGTSLAKHRS